MRLTGIFNNFKQRGSFENNHVDYSPYRVPVRASGPSYDCFVKNNETAFGRRMHKVPSLVKPALEDILNKASATQIYRNNILRLAQYDIPCPCCGHIMLDVDSFHTFKTTVSTLQKPRDILSQIGQYKRYLHPVEKNIFKLFLKENKQNPKMSLLSILKENLPEAERNLVMEQSQIFANIGLFSRDLSPENCEKVSKLLKRTYAQLFDKEPTSKFSRKIFISELDNILQNTEKSLRQNILDTAISLPTAYNNMDAFIVKYAKRNYKKQNPNQAIALRLLSNSTATIEHINPQKLNGTNSTNNLALECACDNNKRNHDSLFEQIKYNPQMLKNYQLYMKRLSTLVEESKLEKAYVIQTNETFGQLSGGLLYRDLSHLRYKLPKRNKTKSNDNLSKNITPKANKAHLKEKKHVKRNAQRTRPVTNRR